MSSSGPVVEEFVYDLVHIFYCSMIDFWFETHFDEFLEI